MRKAAAIFRRILAGLACLLLTGCFEIREEFWIHRDGSGKAERKAIQAAFNQWADETGLPMSHLSVIAAQSIDSH